MKPKFTLLIILLTVCGGAFAQITDNIDSLLTKYDSVSVIPDSLVSKIDTTNKTLIGQKTFTDTSGSIKPVVASQNTEPKAGEEKHDRRWFVSPLLKAQVQDFGMLEMQRKPGESNAYLLPFTRKTNRSLAASLYKNFTKNISMSVDLGMSVGHVTSEDVLIETTQKNNYYLGNATVYYHLLGGHYKLQPFLAAGVNNIMKKENYTSVPVGVGVKFTSKNIMVQGQGAYGYAMSKNLANTIMYNLGVYIPFKTKKQKKREAEEQARRDSALISITNITNNYYLLNNIDSLKKVAEDSIRRAEQQRKDGLAEDVDISKLDEDDPMRLPAAKKYIVYFYYDQYSLTSSAFAVIDQVIAKMKENKSLSVHLKGHTDMSGSEQYNAPLSKKRAQMVFDYMNSRGIAAERMILSSYGKKQPYIKQEDPNTAWMNRRCEIVLFEKK